MNDVLLRSEDLTIGYAVRGRKEHVLASGLSVPLRRGEMVCLVGANGAGKSTLLRTLAGLQNPLHGHILLKNAPDGNWVELTNLDGRSLARRISIVLTERVESEALTAFDLAGLGRYPYTDWSGRLSKTDETVVRWALQAVGAAALAGRNLHQLSDGERQKVMIARALAQQAEIIILDEPTAFLDLPHRVEIMHTLKSLAREEGKAILLSTHDLDLALRSADTLWVLARTPSAAALAMGAPEDLVLNGRLEAAFTHTSVQQTSAIFDRRSGAFLPPTIAGPEIHLVGHGLSALWTLRALQREGFRISRRTGKGNDFYPTQVEVLNGNGERRWRVSEGNGAESSGAESSGAESSGVEEFYSIYELIAHLKATLQVRS